MACCKQEGICEEEISACGSSMKQKLLKLQCPFTWEMLDSMIKYNTSYNNSNDDDTLDEEESSLLELFIKSLFECYKAVMSAHENARTWIMKAEELLMQIQQEQQFCQTVRTFEHVFYATKCFFLYEVQEMDELREILGNIVDTDDFSKLETGTLYGCQSIVWSCLHDFGIDRAIETAKKAADVNQDCALWHFILGKNLRRQRRSIALTNEVSDMEQQHFELAYAMSRENLVFGVYFVQMRSEKSYKFSRDKEYMFRKNNEIEIVHVAKAILKSKPTNFKVLLKLARIFLRVNDSDETLSAKECLDAVESIAPNNSTFLHYSGMLHQACGEFREALYYYKKATECYNFAAECSYIQYGWETGELEPLPHLLRILKKYNPLIKERQITLLLYIGITYYSIYRDMPNAAEYFLKALTVDVTNKKFKVFIKFLDFTCSTFFKFLTRQFLPDTAKLQMNNITFQQTYLKIKNLLSEANLDEGPRSLDFSNFGKEDHDDLNVK